MHGEPSRGDVACFRRRRVVRGGEVRHRGATRAAPAGERRRQQESPAYSSLHPRTLWFLRAASLRYTYAKGHQQSETSVVRVGDSLDESILYTDVTRTLVEGQDFFFLEWLFHHFLNRDSCNPNQSSHFSPQNHVIHRWD